MMPAQTRTQTLKETQAAIASDLLCAGIDKAEAIRETQIILEHATGLNGAHQLINYDMVLNVPLFTRVETIVARRKRREPLQYCLGSAWFMGLELDVEPGVFIPRPDTEAVVNVAAKLIDELERIKGTEVEIAEIGIGSGAISIALLKLNPRLHVTACDVSEKAISVARHNAIKHGVSDRLIFLKGDWKKVLPSSLDLIVSNPPYIPMSERTSLAPEIRDYEPEEALYGNGNDGLSFYRDFASLAPSYLSCPYGFMVVELGDGQSEAVSCIFGSANWREISFHHDLNQTKRVITACVPIAVSPGPSVKG